MRPNLDLAQTLSLWLKIGIDLIIAFGPEIGADEMVRF
jgi:hypothetical protein